MSHALPWLAPALLVVATSVAFLPTLENGFVNFDDIENFLNNRSYRGLGPAQLKWMFTTWNLGGLIPLTWVTLGLDYLIWGMDPAGYHLTSLVLHVLTALVLYFVLLRLLRVAQGPGERDLTALYLGALFGALLFSVHPLRVESVAWVTERRDVLSGLFSLLTVLAYLRAWDTRAGQRLGRTWLLLSLGLFACALLSKAMAVTLPFVLLLLDLYPLRRLRLFAAGLAQGIGPESSSGEVSLRRPEPCLHRRHRDVGAPKRRDDVAGRAGSARPYLAGRPFRRLLSLEDCRAGQPVHHVRAPRAPRPHGVAIPALVGVCALDHCRLCGMGTPPRRATPRLAGLPRHARPRLRSRPGGLADGGRPVHLHAVPRLGRAQRGRTISGSAPRGGSGWSIKGRPLCPCRDGRAGGPWPGHPHLEAGRRMARHRNPLDSCGGGIALGEGA